MLTQYEELRVARGRTLAHEHDTIEEDLGFLKSSFGIKYLFLTSYFHFLLLLLTFFFFSFLIKIL